MTESVPVPWRYRFKDIESFNKACELMVRGQSVASAAVTPIEIVDGVARASKEYKEAPYELEYFTIGNE